MNYREAHTWLFQLCSLHTVNDSLSHIILTFVTHTKKTQSPTCLKNCLAMHLGNILYFIKQGTQFYAG